MSTVAERVARGAALLDEKVPGWAERIDLAELDLSSCWRCVLGQLATSTEPDLEDGWILGRDLGLDGFDGRYGFDRYSDIEGIEDPAAMEPWSELTAEWRRVITERRARVLAGATT
jgi:hypothetical protein